MRSPCRCSAIGKAAIQGALVALLVTGAAAGLYPLWSNWDWHAAVPANSAAGGAGGPDVAAMVAKLEQHLRDQPDDLKGWLMLGRSYMALERFADAVIAYGHAHQLDAKTRTRPWAWASP